MWTYSDSSYYIYSTFWGEILFLLVKKLVISTVKNYAICSLNNIDVAIEQEKLINNNIFRMFNEVGSNIGSLILEMRDEDLKRY